MTLISKVTKVQWSYSFCKRQDSKPRPSQQKLSWCQLATSLWSGHLGTFLRSRTETSSSILIPRHAENKYLKKNLPITLSCKKMITCWNFFNENKIKILKTSFLFCASANLCRRLKRTERSSFQVWGAKNGPQSRKGIFCYGPRLLNLPFGLIFVWNC